MAEVDPSRAFALELPFQDSADTADTRRIVLAEIQRVQHLFLASLEPDAPGRFDWWGTPHSVDRPRWLALKTADVEALADAAERADLLRFYGGEGRTLDVIDVVDVLSWLLSDTLHQHSWLPGATQLLNLVMVQPLVNPAFAPLFWVALGFALDSHDEGSNDLMEVLRPTTFDMSAYPASRSAAPSVREAQASLFRKWSPDLLPADWASLDELTWARACTQVVADARHAIETNVFALITRRAELIRTGLRPR